MTFFAANALCNFITSFGLGLFVFLKNIKGQVNRSYAFLSLSIAFWSGSYFFWQVSKTFIDAIFWVRMLSLGAIFIPILFLYHILCLLKQQKEKRAILKSGFIFSIILALFVFSRFFISGLRPKLFFPFWPNAGFLYSLFLAFFFFCVVYAIFLLVRAFKISSESEYRRQQLRYAIFASIVGFLGGSTNYPLWYDIPVLPVLNFLVAVHVFILAYAIIKYRFMDIRTAITRTTIFIVVYALVLGLPFLLATSGKGWLIKFLGIQWWLGPLILMASLGTIGPFVFISLKNRAEAILFREQRLYQEALKNASVDLTRIRNLQKLMDFITQVITESVKITHSAIYFLDAKSNRFVLRAGMGIPKEQPKSIPGDSYLIGLLQKNRESLIYEEVKRKSEENRDHLFSHIEKQLTTLYASMVVPCFLENKLLNIIVLGEKLSGQLYSQEDIDHFEILAGETALATENALLYDKIENEVKDRTHDLIETQKQLVQAEKLATVGTLAGGVAHEINNPLTAILTNAQMLLTSGEMDRESLEMIEEATKRCKTIVQKLMAYSKKPMETTMVYKINLLEVINNAVNFLKFQLEQDNVKVIISNSESDYPVKGNHNELEQVITNIVLNAKDAIKQLKKSGTIEITISQRDNIVKVEIKDDGTGIPKEILGRIFDPFFTTKEVGKGLGLGLSICQAIIDKHNGKISVQSQLNKGSIFTVQLPKIKLT